MAKLYPHKQTVIIFIVCIAVVALMLWYSNAFGTQGGNKQNVTATTGSNSLSLGTSTDWQKQFFDTSSGGVKLIAKKVDVTTDTKPTLTDQLGINYFSEYIKASQAGLEGDPDVVNSINNRFIGTLADKVKPTTYSLKDIRISYDSSTNALVAYGKSLMSILKNIPTEDAAEIANTALKDDMTLLTKIDPIIAEYKSIVTDLKNMSVPQAISSHHLAVLNSVAGVLYNAEALRNVEIDPALGIATLGVYVSTLQGISTALANMQSFLQTNNIYFQ